MYNSIIFTDITDNVMAVKALGAYKLAQVLRENGYTCLVIDNFYTFDKSELLKLLDLAMGDQTYLIGFSNTFLANSNIEKNPDGSTPPFTYLYEDVFFPQGQDIENEVIEYVRKKNSKTKIVVGGARANPNCKSKNVDYQIIGYAETSIVNLMDHLSKGVTLNHAIKNLWKVTVIDDRTAKEYDFQNSKMDWEYTDIVNQTILPFEIARGCIFKCKFCSYPMNGKQQLDFVRNPKRLVYELEKNHDEYGIDTYYIVDDTFNDNDFKIDSILQEFKKLKFQPQFWSYSRLDLLSRDVDTNIDKLYDIGMRGTQFGIETLNQKTGTIIGKGHSRKKQIAAVQHIRKKYGNKISMHGTFIVGLPEESEKSSIETNKLLLSGELPLHSWRFNALMIQKNDRFAWNSEIGANYQNFGYKEIETVDSDSYITWKNKHTDVFRARELAATFNQQGQNCDHYYVPNIYGWSIMSLGYTHEYLTTTLYRNINFNEIENRKIKFAQDYKEKLFAYLAKS